MIFLVFSLLFFRIGVALFSHPKTWQTFESPGKTPLVLAQNEDSVLEHSGIESHFFKTSGPPYQRSQVLVSNTSRNTSHDGQLRAGLSLALWLRQSQQQTSSPLSYVRKALDHRNAAFKSAKEPISRAESKPRLGFAACQHSSAQCRLGSDSGLMGTGAMGQISQKEITSTEVQCKPWPQPQGYVQREAQRRTAQCPAGQCRSLGTPWTACSAAYISGSTLVDGTASPDPLSHSTRLQSRPRVHCSGSCRGQAPQHVCLVGKTSGGPTSRDTAGNAGGQGARRGDCYQVLAQTGDCAWQSAHGTAQCQCGQADAAFIMESFSGRAGLQMGGVLQPVPATGDSVSRSGKSGPDCARDRQVQPSCFQVHRAQGRPEHGSAGDSQCERRGGRIEGVERSCKHKCSKDHRQLAAPRCQSTDLERQCRRAHDSRNSRHAKGSVSMPAQKSIRFRQFPQMLPPKLPVSRRLFNWPDLHDSRVCDPVAAVRRHFAAVLWFGTQVVPLGTG